VAATRCETEPVFLRMLEVMLPHGGGAMIQVEAYFDESGSHSGAPVLCVAGYLFQVNRARRLTRSWRAALDEKGLPYFRMSECAHGNGPFASLTKPERIQLAARMIEIIKRDTIQGIAVTVNEAEFREHMLQHALVGSSYSFAAHVILAGVASWIGANPTTGSVAYFFEAGHLSQPEANAIMTLLFRSPRAKASHRYAGHAFVEKETTPAVQAADLLAWQWYTDRRHHLEGRPRRKDCAILLEHHHNANHIGPVKLAALAKALPFGANDATDLLRLHDGDEHVNRRL
jgi:hypothetical protein